jgi:hypothetical protein
LSGADLRDADLRRAVLHRADLSDADLRGADLRGADLRGADLRGADLSGADLRGADLRDADLRGANLSGADLRGADLRGADLRAADLSDADLSDADLRGAVLSSCTIDGVPLTVEQWCDIQDMPHVGRSMRLAFKRLPENRTTVSPDGKYSVVWTRGKTVECADWDPKPVCAGGLHLSPTAAATRKYNSGSLCIPVAFDPADAVLLGDKLKVRKAKVLG